MQDIRKKIAGLKPGDMVFYLTFLFFFNLYFFVTTEFFFEGTKSITGPLLLLYKVFFTILYSYCFHVVFIQIERVKDRIIPIALFLVALIYSCKREPDPSGYLYIIFVFVMLIIASYKKSGRMIMLLCLISSWAWLIICFLASRAGIITDLVDINGRHAFGIVFATDLGCHLFFTAVAVCILRNGELKKRDYAVLVALLLINVLFVRAKISIICTFLLLLISVMAPVIRKRSLGNRKKLLLTYGLITGLAFVFFAVFTIAWSYGYDPSPDVFYNKYGFLNTLRIRLRVGREAFDNYGITLWGQNVISNGWTIDSMNDPDYHYFFLDISYVRLLFHNGIAMLTAFLFMESLLQFKFYREKKFFLMGVLAIIALDMAIEHHMTEMSYNFPLLLLFAETDLNRSSS